MNHQIRFLIFLFLLFSFVVALWYLKPSKDQEKFYQRRVLNLDFSNKKKVSEQRIMFMDSIIRAAQYSNFVLAEKRKKLLKIQAKFEKKKKLNGVYLHWFEQLSAEFLPEKPDVKDSVVLKQALMQLSLRVQIVPVRLTLSQAILESAWGESRFAKEGNAYFGIHCYSKGCGMKFGSGKSNVFVKTYPSLKSSVEDYMHFLNTKRGTKNFRLAREVYFESEQKDILHLAAGLDSYSEIGGHYQKIIRSLIKNYIPDEIEDY